MNDVIIVAIIAAFPPTLVAGIGWLRTKRDLGEIHVLVNSRLTEALDEIENLRTYIDERLPAGQSSADAVPRPPEGNQSL